MQADRLLRFARKKGPTGPNDPMEKAVMERCLCNADRANYRAVRALVDYFPGVGGRAGVVASVIKCIVLKYTPVLVVRGVVSPLVGRADVGLWAITSYF